MSHQIHLEHRLFHRHMLDGEPLGPHDPELGLLLLGCEVGDFGGVHRALEGVGAQTLFQAGLVLADLALHAGDTGVNGCAHIGGTLRSAEDHAAGADRNFADVPVLFHTEDDRCLAFRLEIAVQLAYLLFRIGMDGRGQSDLLVGEYELHSIQLLLSSPHGDCGNRGQSIPPFGTFIIPASLRKVTWIL